MPSSLRSLFAFAFLAACGGNVVVDHSSGTGGAPGTGGSTGTGGATGTGSCLPAATAIPQAYKACTTNEECFQGNVVAAGSACCIGYVLGVGATHAAELHAYQQACATSPNCGCVMTNDVAENGKTGNIQVECQNGLCMTVGQ